MKAIVEVQNLYKSFYGALALNGMNFTINEGEIRCLIGENGCGKSTLIKVISGFHSFDSGELIINNKKYEKITTAEAIAEGIQVIYQDFSLFPNMTIAENIMMYSTVAERKIYVDWNDIKASAQKILDQVGFEIDPNLYVAGLSVAQKQMVAICRAIVQKAKLLIMDEPTTALTTKEVQRLFEIVRRLKDSGVSVLFVSHKLDEVSQICDSYTIMRNGRRVFQSDVGDAKITNEEIVYYMTGKRYSNSKFTYVPKNDIPAMKVNGLCYKKAFRDIQFTLRKGEVLGITGLLGCGRSELAKALFGLITPTKGSIEISGKNVGIFRNVEEAIRYKIAYVPEDRLTEGLHLDQSIADNIIARIIRDYTNKAGIVNVKRLKKKQYESMNLMEVTGMIPGNPANSLSGGNQQKIVLMKWLASDPDILILNCPTVGVDVGAKSDIHNIIKDLAKEKGIGVIVVSNDNYELMQTCNRVLVMKEGFVVEELFIKDQTLDEFEMMTERAES